MQIMILPKDQQVPEAGRTVGEKNQYYNNTEHAQVQKLATPSV